MFCELLKPFLLGISAFVEIQLEIRKLEAKNTLPEYHKTRFDSKLVFFKKNSFINANQSE